MNNLDVFKAYREAKANADKWKKEAEELGKLLKTKLIDTPIVEKEGYRYERKVSVRQKIDEGKLLEWLQGNGHDEAIKYKAVVDEEKVSEMVGKGLIDIEVIDGFITKSEVVSLYCKKAKVNKEAE